MRNKRSDGRETRQKLLDSAVGIFAANGYRDTTVSEICKLAETNVAAVNYYFGSKEELYVESWRYAFGKSIKLHPPDGGIQATALPEERFRGHISSIMRRIMDPESRDFDIVNKEMASPTGLLNEVMRKCLEPLKKGTIQIVRELLGGKVSEEDVQLCEMSIMSQCFAPLRHLRRNKGSFSPGPPNFNFELDALVDHIVRFSLAGITGVRISRSENISEKRKK